MGNTKLTLYYIASFRKISGCIYNNANSLFDFLILFVYFIIDIFDVVINFVRSNKNYIYVFVLLFSWSPLTQNILGFQGNYLYLFFIFVFIALGHNKFAFTSAVPPIFIFLLLIGFLPAIYYGAPKYVLVPIYFIAAYVAIVSLSYYDLLEVVVLSTNILLLMLLLSLLSFVLFYIDVLNEPFLCIVNEDGRDACMYGFTMSNSMLIGNFFRPAGVYDEPGAFSFIICSIAIMREVVGLDSRKTKYLLLLGFMTFSLMHFIFVVLYYLHRLFMNPRFRITLFAGFKVLVFFVIMVALFELFYDTILSRLEFVDGRFVGDNRSERMMATIRMLGLNEFFFGIGPSCVITGYECDRSAVGVFDSNPFTLLAGYGVVLSSPYYAILILTFVYGGLLNKKILFFSLFLMLLQRPSVFAFGYSLVILTVLLSAALSIKVGPKSGYLLKLKYFS